MRSTCIGHSVTLRLRYNRLNSFDFGIVHFINQFAQRSWLFDRVVVLVEDNYLLKGAFAMSIFWWIWFDRKRRSDEDKKILIFGIMLSFASLLVARGLALMLPFRQRPLRNPALHFQIPFTLNPNVLLGWSSLPSDHATLYFCLAIALFFISRKLGLAAFVYTSIVVCLPRLYLGIHYPTDLLAGALLGILIGSLVGIRKIRNTIADPFIHWMETSPQSFYPVLFFCTFCVAQQFDGVREVGKFTFEIAKMVVHHHHKIG